jgi:hypothetical protein
LEKSRAYIMIKLWMCQVSCYILWISRKGNVTWATRRDGEDSGHLNPFKILGSINPATGPRRPWSSRSMLWKQKTLQESVIDKNISLLIPHTGIEVTYIRKLKPNCNIYSKSVVQNFQVQFKYTHKLLSKNMTGPLQ